nr:immunoglobulin heavy chain junction region [Mus musculus]
CARAAMWNYGSRRWYFDVW